MVVCWRRGLVCRHASGSATSSAHGIEFRTAISCGGVNIVADMPKENGESRKSPSPKDLVMAGLAACTSMTIQVFRLTESLFYLCVHNSLHTQSHAAGLVRSKKLQPDAITCINVTARDSTPAGSHFPDSVEVVVEIKVQKSWHHHYMRWKRPMVLRKRLARERRGHFRRSSADGSSRRRHADAPSRPCCRHAAPACPPPSVARRAPLALEENQKIS
jgi:hypothetical protein